MRVRGLIAAASLALALAVPAASEPLKLSPAEMRKAAVLSLKVGRARQATTLAEALLERDPTDVKMRLVASRAARDLGDFQSAKRHAQLGWAQADVPEDSFTAAMLMAQALSSDGKRTRAQLWLRRAKHVAPTPEHASRAVRDFRYVRVRNPWQTHLSFSVQPNSNINNGSSERFSTLNYALSKALFGQALEYELGGTAVALSGTEYRFGLNSRYRLHETATRAHDLFFEIDLREFTLSSEAKTLAPDARASDFAFSSLSAGYGVRGINREGRGEARGRFELGHSWYGGDPLAQFAQITGAQSFFLEQGKRLDFSLTAKRQFGEALPDVDSVTSDVTFRRKVGRGHDLMVNLSFGAAHSPNSDYSYDSVGAAVQFALAEPVMSADLVFGLSLSRRDFDSSRHSADGRKDDKVSVDMTMIFREVDYYGFNPSVTFSASTTDSTVGLYSADRLGVSLGIRSAF
ncbi:MAG: hypothetical protein HRU30_10255 [Rhodobacteraceae bacterium]|nr:hypothetical protein [Paracoccaceae bacterium]